MAAPTLPPTTVLEAFDTVALAASLGPRLDAARAELARHAPLAEELRWVDAARARLAAARGDLGDLPLRALRLEELDAARAEHAKTLQGAAVDAFERLLAGIGFAGGPRSPLLEALAPRAKLVVVRKAERGDFERFLTDIEKRLASSYARRMLADETYTKVEPTVVGLREAFAAWRDALAAELLEGEEADALRAEVFAASARLDVAVRQARLLALAALTPLRELRDEPVVKDLRSKRKEKAGAKDEGEEPHPLLERDPPDPRAPSPEERAELDGVE